MLCVCALSFNSPMHLYCCLSRFGRIGNVLTNTINSRKTKCTSASFGKNLFLIEKL